MSDVNVEAPKNNHQSRKQKKHRLTDMIQCPYCKAFSYPKIYKDPKDEEQKKAILCGACMANVVPYINAREAYEKKMQEEYLLKAKEKFDPQMDELIEDRDKRIEVLNKIGDEIVVVNDEGQEEHYPNAERIVAEVLTEGNEWATVKTEEAK